MSRIRSKDTGPEMALRHALHRRGMRYRIHEKGLPGRPDTAITKWKVAVFVDGDFWHGWDFERWKVKLKPYWREKIERNRLRDREHSKLLENEDWLVIRFWEHEVRADVGACAELVARAVESRKLRVPGWRT
jgi:DNA mismatch endonuclease (patch repair protein)